MKLIKISLLLVISVSCFSSTSASPIKLLPASPAFVLMAEIDEAPQLMVVKFHADWCGSCRALGPALTDLSNKLDGQAVLFTELDMTNQTRKHQSLLLASALGLSEVVTQNPGTGFMLVIDGKTKEVKAKLDKTQSVKEMAKVITGLL